MMVLWVKRLRLTRSRLSSLDDLRQRQSGGARLRRLMIERRFADFRR